MNRKFDCIKACEKTYFLIKFCLVFAVKKPKYLKFKNEVIFSIWTVLNLLRLYLNFY